MNRRSFFAIAASGLIVAADLTLAISADRRDRRRPRPKPDNPVDERTQAIAEDLVDSPEFVGIGIEILLPLLAPILMSLFKCLFERIIPTPAQAKAAAEKAYDAATDTYDERLMQRGRVTLKKQAKRKDQLLNTAQANLTIKTSLDHLRLGHTASIKAYCDAARTSKVEAAKED